MWNQHCICPTAVYWFYFIRYSLELNYFERRAAKTNYFIFNWTGNVRQTADWSPRDIGGGVMKNKVWYRTKPRMVVFTMSDIDIAWPENLLWIYIFSIKRYVMKTSWTTIMSRGDRIHISIFWGPKYSWNIISTSF